MLGHAKLFTGWSAVLLVLGVFGVVPTAIAGVSDSDLAEAAGAEWLHNHGSWDGSRYSTLDEINADNAGELKLAWTLSTGTTGNQQATPIFHDGILYFPIHGQTVLAVDARSGKEVWRYKHELPENYGGFVPNFLGQISKGVAIYKDRILFYTNDSKLVALHYKTGDKLYDVQVRPYVHVNEAGEEQLGYYSTLAPLVVPGLVLLGQSHGEQGGSPAYLDAVNPMTGEIVWSANVIPQEGEEGHDTWYGDSAETGGAPLWINGTYDAETNLTYWGTGNAYPWNATERRGPNMDMDNIGAAGIMAVDVSNGNVEWRTQLVPGDNWDFDTMAPPIVADVDGRKTLIQPNKTGFIHYLDARSGECFRSVQFIENITWAEGYDENCRPVGEMAPPEVGGDPILKCPSLMGGVNLYPSAYNPQTGMVYMPARDMCDKWGYDEIVEIGGVKSMGASTEMQPGNEINTAFNVSSGAEVWRDEAADDGFAGGMLTTAGNITVYGSSNGDINVVNATTGENLWTFPANITHKAGAMTYELDGKQYFAQLSGGVQLGGAAFLLNTAPDGGMLYVFSR